MNNVSSSNGLDKLVPKLRFPEFSEEWQTVKLSDFVERITRKNNKNQTNLPLTISSKDGLVDQITYFSKTVASKDMSGYYLLMNGEFAYNKSYSVGYDFGSIKRLDRYPMGALSTLYICFTLKKYDSDFMKFYFDSLKWYREIYMIAAEGARNHGLLNVPTEAFFETRHTLPMSIAEQQKIASFLTLIDKRIAKQRELVESLKSYKRGVFKNIFSSISQFRKLRDISEYLTSDMSLESIENKPSGHFPVYDASGISSYISDYRMESDYIAIIKDGSGVGRLQYCKEKSSFIGTLGGIVANGCSTAYLYAALQMIDFRQFVTGATIPHIYYKDYKNIAVPFPDFEIQRRIEGISKLLDRDIVIADEKLCLLNRLKAELMQQLFI